MRAPRVNRRAALTLAVIGVVGAGALLAPAQSQSAPRGPLPPRNYTTGNYDSVVTKSYDFLSRYGHQMHVTVNFPARNGVAAPGRFPVIAELAYTEYLGNEDPVTGTPSEPMQPASNESGEFDYFTKQGYVTAEVNTPGTGQSEGIWDFRNPAWQNEVVDEITWLGTQPWSTGSVGTIGESGNGMNQIVAAQHRPKYLKTMIVQAVPSDLWDVLWEGGMFNLDITAVGCAIATGGPDVLNNIGNVDKMRKKAENFEYTGFKCPFLTASEMYHDTYDAYWQRNRAHVENINIPVWCQDTWNDLFPLTMPRWCAKMGSPNKMFTMSIGSHGAPNAQASFGFVQQNLRWFDFWLKGIRNGVDQDVKKRGYQYYVQQAAKWRTLPTFTGTTSVPEARNTNFHLTSDAAHPLASGGLDKTPSGDPVSAQYTYNPASGALDGPAHYWAQNNAEQYDSEFQANNDPSGPQDQRSEQTGRVAFAATPLKADTEVTGPVTMHLCATTTAEDTDFVFKLVDVYPDEFVAQGPQPGYWKFVTEGQIKGQFRSEQLGYFHKWPIPPAPKAVCYDIAAHPTSYVFKKGHSMAVIVQSADAVRYRPNTNPAVVTVVSTKQNPSFVTLPIRPGAGR